MTQQAFRPTGHNCELVRNEIILSMKRDKRGDLHYYVQYDGAHYVRFEKMESAIDFIHSNF